MNGKDVKLCGLRLPDGSLWVNCVDRLASPSGSSAAVDVDGGGASVRFRAEMRKRAKNVVRLASSYARLGRNLKPKAGRSWWLWRQTVHPLAAEVSTPGKSAIRREFPRDFKAVSLIGNIEAPANPCDFGRLRLRTAVFAAKLRLSRGRSRSPHSQIRSASVGILRLTPATFPFWGAGTGDVARSRRHQDVLRDLLEEIALALERFIPKISPPPQGAPVASE